ncbi:hypothetical protein QC762_100020 [Podospora pseudocomata]|uniref:Carboxylic ester hydrolase n=1 Tax=Podospora pseudocomata TaxID=2093779 RepID=A0ABR0GRF4_9PEZI|nr:hypothetical protein QC762_100020 [Podospora pseudocomata]
MGILKYLAVAGLVASTSSSSLPDVCTTAFVESSLPAPDFFPGLELIAGSVTAQPVTNFTAPPDSTHPGATGRDFCNVTFAYRHVGRPTDRVNLWLYLPSPAQFKKRFLATGGGGLSMTLGARGLATGLSYGAVSITTDAGFGGFDSDLSRVILYGNGAMNYDALIAYSYRAMHEMTVLGKELTRKFYNASNSTKIYSYFHGCSEGGREGMSQVQKYGTTFDGISVGSPAFRHPIFHYHGPLSQRKLNYFPSVCELSRITADAIAFCDPLDGKTDGVVARTDLCFARFNASSSIGNPYNCSAVPQLGQPPIAGTVSAKAAAVAAETWRGMYDSNNKLIHPFFAPSVEFGDSVTILNPATNQLEPFPNPLSPAVVNLLIKEVYSPTLPLDEVSPDIVREWVNDSMAKYLSGIYTLWPDLTPFKSNGGKMIFWHGEADAAIPAVSSTMYQDKVRKTMYPGLGVQQGYAEMSKWNKLFLVPGGGHCDPGTVDPLGVFKPNSAAWPTEVLKSLMEWVEEGKDFERLEGIVQGGEKKGEKEGICGFPLRPVWAGNNGSDGKGRGKGKGKGKGQQQSEDEEELQCVFDQQSFEFFTPKLDSFLVDAY